MKVSKTSLLVLGVGIFLVAVFFQYRAYSKQISEQAALSANITASQEMLRGLVAQKQTRDGELTQVQSKLATANSTFDKAKAAFPQSVESIEYDERLFSIADNFSVAINNITVSNPTSKKVDQVTISITSFTLEVTGSVDNILEFIHGLNSDAYFSTSIIKAVNLSPPNPLTEEQIMTMTEEEIEAVLGAASINLDVYSYQAK